MADEKIQIQQLDPLSKPTIGYSIPAQKTLDVPAKRIDLGLFQSYDTGSGFVGCYTQRQRIGSWNMKTTLKQTINLTDPSSIIAIEPGIIINDSGIQYPWHGVYDSYFHQTLVPSAYGNVSSSGTSENVTEGNTSDSSSGNTGLGNTGKLSLFWNGVISDAAVATKIGGSGILSASKDAGHIYTISHNLNSEVKILLSPIVTNQENILGVSIKYPNTDSVTVKFAVVDETQIDTSFYLEVYRVGYMDSHSHAIGSHNHDLIGSHTHALSVSASGVSFNAGAWGKNIQVTSKWTEGDSQVFLTHNNLGAASSRYTDFGVVSGYANAYLMNEYTGSGNRGFINIIRKFES